MALIPAGTNLSKVTVGSRPATPEAVEAAIAAQPPAQQASLLKMILSGDRVDLKPPTGPTAAGVKAQKMAAGGSTVDRSAARAADLNSRSAAGQLGAAPGATLAPTPAPTPDPALVAEFEQSYVDPSGISPLRDPRVRQSTEYQKQFAAFMAKRKLQAPLAVPTPAPAPAPVSDAVSPDLLSSLLNTYRG